MLTAHDVLPREPRPGQRAAQRRLYDRFDAVVVHSEHGRRAPDRASSASIPRRVHVIPHGVFEHLAEARPRSRRAAPFETEKPVVLCFGLMRPYKGIDLLLEAWRGIERRGAVDRGDAADGHLRRCSPRRPPACASCPRFIADAELPAYFRRADLVVLPYREIDQSGVLFTALAFGKPLLLSDVGGFPEVAATGAARLFPAGDAGALRDALRELLDDPAALARDGRARARRPPGDLLVGARSPAARSTSTSAALRPAGRENPRCSPRDPLLAVRGADRVDPARLRRCLCWCSRACLCAVAGHIRRMRSPASLPALSR